MKKLDYIEMQNVEGGIPPIAGVTLGAAIGLFVAGAAVIGCCWVYDNYIAA